MSFNPLSKNEPWDLVAEGYSQTTQQMLAEYSKDALEFAGVSSEDIILDVACGPGTLSLLAAPKVARIDAIDFSKQMLTAFEQSITKAEIKNISLSEGDGQNVPFEDETYDAAFSMFGLMFFPNRLKGFGELYRTLKPGGTAAVSSWVPLDESPEMKLMFDTLKVMNPDMPEPGSVIDTLQNPELFKSEMEQSGFKEVTIQRITKQYRFESVDDYWDSMTRGSVPIVMLKNSWDSAKWKSAEKKALEYLQTVITELPKEFSMSAFIGIGKK